MPNLFAPLSAMHFCAARILSSILLWVCLRSPDKISIMLQLNPSVPQGRSKCGRRLSLMENAQHSYEFPNGQAVESRGRICLAPFPACLPFSCTIALPMWPLVPWPVLLFGPPTRHANSSSRSNLSVREGVCVPRFSFWILSPFAHRPFARANRTN